MIDSTAAMSLRDEVHDQRPQRLLTPDELASILGLTRFQIIRQSRQGRIPSLKIGKCYRYRKSSIVAWLRERERAA
jgi:excisionase family DNA binding protein